MCKQKNAIAFFRKAVYRFANRWITRNDCPKRQDVWQNPRLVLILAPNRLFLPCAHHLFPSSETNPITVYALLWLAYDLALAVHDVGRRSSSVNLCLLASFLSNASLDSFGFLHPSSRLALPLGFRVVFWITQILSSLHRVPRSTPFIAPWPLPPPPPRPHTKGPSEPTLQGRRDRVLDPIASAEHSPTELSPPPSTRTPSLTLSDSTTPPTPQSLFSTMPLPVSKRQIHPAITYKGIPPYLCF